MKRIAALALTLAAAAAAAQPVRAPHHGDVLFHHFQGRWVAALGALMTSQHFRRLAPHEADAELLRGGLLLDWGQHDEAAQVFERVAADHPEHRDRAWTLLAKARWQRGQVDAAEAALARVQAPLPGAERDAERVLLGALVHLARGGADRAGQAAELLQPLAATLPAAPVARFNRAVALQRSGRGDEARAVLDALGRERAATEELRTLRDRANLALGQQALRDGGAAEARGALQRVRLHGASSTAALLAEGWAALQQGHAGQAVIAWTELAGRAPGDEAVFEARLALPRAYAQAGARGQALQQAEALLAQLADERRSLQGQRAAFADGSALDPLLAQLQAHQPGDAVDQHPPPAASAAALGPLWADHGFQTALARWADLHWAGRRLDQWAQALPAFDQMRELRLQGFLHKLPPTLAAAADSQQGLAAQRLVHDELAQRLQQAEAGDDGAALAHEAELRQLALLQRVRQGLQALDGQADLAPLHDRARRLHGLLLWQLAQQRPERLRAAHKALQELARALARAQLQTEALERGRAEEPQRLAALGERLQRHAQALAALQPQLLALRTEQRAALQAQGVAALDARVLALAGYEMRARLLQVQLQDGQALVQQRDEAGHAPR